MSNSAVNYFDVAEIAVRKACEILNIKEPEVVFFKTKGNDDSSNSLPWE